MYLLTIALHLFSCSDLTSFTHEEARRVGMFEQAMASFLRGGAGVSGPTKIYDGTFYNDAGIDCDLCADWDDDDPPSDAKQEWIDRMVNDALKASSNHGRWELDWCIEISNGPYMAFDGAYDCEISVKNCGTRRSESEVVAKNAASVLVGSTEN